MTGDGMAVRTVVRKCKWKEREKCSFLTHDNSLAATVSQYKIYSEHDMTFNGYYLQGQLEISN